MFLLYILHLLVVNKEPYCLGDLANGTYFPLKSVWQDGTTVFLLVWGTTCWLKPSRVCCPGKPGILLWHFPGLGSPRKILLVLESSGNLFNSSNMVFFETGDENKEKYQLGDIVWFNTKLSELTLPWYKKCMAAKHELQMGTQVNNLSSCQTMFVDQLNITIMSKDLPTLLLLDQM